MSSRPNPTTRLRFSASLLAIAMGVTPALALAQAPPPAAPAPVAVDDPVVARVGTTVLHRSDVLAAQKQLPPQVQAMPLQQIYPLLLDQMVNILILADAGKQENLQDDPEVKRRIQSYADRAVEEAYVSKLVAPAVTDAKLHARYDEEVKQNPAKEEVQASHILVADEATAKDIIAQLDKGADFATLAKDKSTDPGSKNGGDLGWFSREDMVPEFADAAFKLKPGEYTKIPVKSQFGWHVIKLTGRRQAPPPSFDEMKSQLASQLSREVVDAKVQSLRGSEKVETFALDGGPIQTPGLQLAPEPAPK